MPHSRSFAQQKQASSLPCTVTSCLPARVRGEGALCSAVDMVRIHVCEALELSGGAARLQPRWG